ncbi:hypothetical protein Bsph_0394 [Lysinibacillus sphaericus C3-41]|uniref:Uncharacterized protein n=1 Tax=Lysinibacillus sphaericus (strain C3-41) TaxID=444177 RepID=B1HVK2_LYSSC|nr:hypothetical protein Bsph_0394 [Lysinibacillus sphaericus C3-41]
MFSTVLVLGVIFTWLASAEGIIAPENKKVVVAKILANNFPFFINETTPYNI